MARSPQAPLEDRPKTKRVAGLRGLAPFLAPYKMMAVATLAALVATACVTLILPVAVRRVVDSFQSGGELLDEYFLAAHIIAALLALGTAVRYWLVSRFGERVVADIRKAVFDRVIGLSPAFYEKILTGEIISRITTDTTLIQSLIGSSVSVALRNLLILIGGLIMLMLTSAKLTGLVLLIVPLVVVPIIIMGRRLRKLSRENQDWIASSSGSASEALLSVQTVQAFTHEPRTRAAFSDVTEKAFGVASARITMRAVMTALVIFLVFAGIVGVLWIGARDVRAGAMTVGELVQFVIYAVMVSAAVGALSEIWGELLRAAGATERLVELLNSEDSVQDPAEPKALALPAKGAITFDDVTFHYPSRPEMSALNTVNLSIEPGETVALVGPSGAGKTTIIQMILRFYDPETGRILIDGQDLRSLKRADFRRAIALVPQDPVIFATTARENIRFGRPEATDAEVEEAARAAHAHDFLSALPQGFDTYVGERGVMLSGGQKQRIAIARAILRDAPILLLDEATSALDAASERAVQAAFDEMRADRTTLIVAHRLATVKKADRIVVFDQGEIIAQGTHESLVAEGGLYARLARLQFTQGGEE
ncbi:ATP-binding cassette subfamily B protein [Rhodobacter aestuarii]|uniref:ATP-binding cassette, subfamily B n=1 Tax=Rhodobacter aestuarii TaxID=453582 RepID=A0A1N7K6V9_9RHOB|nr:ABC transporter transmembrane domain-containing protein [Rhodobacter aestuarii]PTV95834.1 ATP-binding cassette subfamily B protein [Rhodobacter aestuarii]SIS57278.1 ATP-binding cassette, subfamily B [Rhodobacter aestuarii]